MRKAVFTSTAVLEALLGLPLLIAPAWTLGLYGVTVEAGGAMMARLLGAAAIAMAMVFWGVRQASPQVQAPVAFANLCYNAVAGAVIALGLFQHTVGPLGAVVLVLHLAMAAGFACLPYLPPAQPRTA